ncbi:MAG: sugar ABC transporter substrate-binding protein [Candidatus Omnitrophica bacterium]|nr:sugar ABC transporter substrate-binding protein [Candidatus Omnitrophota bacterium]
MTDRVNCTDCSSAGCSESQAFRIHSHQRTNRITGWAVLMMAAIFLAGCGENQRPGKEILRYSFWGGYLEMGLWKQLKQTFEEKNPDVTIKLEYAPGSDSPASLVTRMLARSAAECMMIDDDGLPWLASKGYLEPLDDYIARDAAELGIEEFLPTAMESVEYEKQRWAMPWDGFCEMIYVNLGLFEQAGIPEPAQEWTWDDFARIAHQLTRDLDGDGVIDQYGAFLPMNTHHHQKVLWSFGASWMDSEKKRITIGTPEAVKALDWYANILFRNKGAALQAEAGMGEEVMLFTNRVGMVACPAYIMINLRQMENRKWDVYHIPKGPAGRAARVSWDCIAIFSKAPQKKKELAWRWIRHILSSESQRLIGASSRALPVREADARASFIRPDTPQHEERFLEAMLEYGRLTPITLSSVSWRQEADFIWSRFGSEATNDWALALRNGEDPPDRSRHHGDPSRWLSPEETIALCQERCQRVVDDFNRRGY